MSKPNALAAKLALFFQPRQHPSSLPSTQNGRHKHTLDLVHIIFLAIVVSISLPVIVLRAVSYNFIHSNLNMAFVYHTLDKTTNAPIAVIMAAIPKNVHQIPASLVLVTAILTFMLSAIHLALILSSKRTNKTTHSPIFSHTTTLIYILLALSLLLSVVLLSISHTSSSHFLVSDLDSLASILSNDTNWIAHDYIRYDVGTFDLETWACELKDVAGAVEAKGDYARQCEIERAARVMMVPYFILLWAVAAVGVWGWVMRVGSDERDAEGVKAQRDVEATADVEHGERVERRKEDHIEASAIETAVLNQQTDTNRTDTATMEDQQTTKTESVKNIA